MFVNCKKLIDKDSLVKIFNLFEDPITGINVYVISQTYDAYDRALSFGLTITIDDTNFTINKLSKGTPLNPIVYSRPVSGCKLKIHNETDDLIGLIAGSDNSDLEDNWVKGFNPAHLDDSINLSVNWSNITDQILLKYITDNLIIVVNPIFFKHVRPEDEAAGTGEELSNGYGLSAWGGMAGSYLEGYGG